MRGEERLMDGGQESGLLETVRLALAIDLLLLIAVMSLVCVMRIYKAVRDAPRTPMLETSGLVASMG